MKITNIKKLSNGYKVVEGNDKYGNVYKVKWLCFTIFTCYGYNDLSDFIDNVL